LAKVQRYPRTGDSDQTIAAAGSRLPVPAQIVETPAVIEQVALTWETLRSEALPCGASKELTIKIAEERWT
jgi:hypothetical protein